MSLEIVQAPSKRLRSSIDKRVVVEQNIQVDCSRTIANRRCSPYSTLYELEGLKERDRRLSGSNLKARTEN
jgi:hypothetical protein